MKEYNNNQPNLNQSERQSFSNKFKKFIENTKKAVRDAIATTSIALSTLIPSSVHSLSSLTLTTTAALAVACCDKPDITPPTIDVVTREITISGGEQIRISGNQVYVGNTLVFRFNDDISSNLKIVLTFNGKSVSSGSSLNESGTLSGKATDEAGNMSTAGSVKINKQEVINKPEITVLKPQVDISKGGKTSVNGKEFFVGDEKVISWTEDNCTPSIKFDGKDVTIGYVVEKEGTLSFTLTNNKGVSDSKTINCVDGNEAPEITIYKNAGNIFGGVTVKMENNQLIFGNVLMAKGTDDNTKDLVMRFEVDGKEIKSGEIVNVSSGSDHIGKFTVIDEKDKTANGEIKLTNDMNSIISGLDKLNGLTMEVDKQVNLLNDISFNGVDLVKVEVEIDGKRYEISHPYNYTPTTPGTCKVILTVKGEFGNTSEISSSTLTIKGPEYHGLEINNINPESLVPQVERGDMDVYKHIEHLRIPESTKIVDMMWKYGAGNHSPEQYQQLMMRLNTGMMQENPIGDDNNYEIIGEKLYNDPSDHAYIERYILNTLIKHANFKIIDTWSHRYDLYTLCKSDPTKINMFGLSKGALVDKDQYNERHEENNKEYDKEKNRLVFCAGGNISYQNGRFINKIYQEDYSLPDEHSAYGARSRTHNKTDKILDRHLVITISTDEDGDIDQTNEQTESSVFPVGFHDKVLFAGRIFPYKRNPNDKVGAPEGRKYNTSFPNYLNLAIMDLCFQMFAEVKDVDELLEMVRSTCDTDHIRFNGEDQPLQLMNPAKFFKKYLMPKDIPTNISVGQTIPLEKGYYKGIVFAIPGAEVKINGQWVAYSKENEALIKSQNPMTLEWRLNGDLVAKYNKNGAVTGKVIAVDDERNGLNLDIEDITVSMQNIAGIFSIGIGNTIVLTNLFNQGPIHNIPSSIRPGETVMLSSISNEGVIYDIPGAQPYIKGKSWVDYNDKNKALVQAQDLKNLQWRLNGDIAIKKCRNGYIKGNVYAINDKGETINKQQVIIRIEDKIQDSNHGYIADNYVKSEGDYRKNEGDYRKSEGDYRKSEGEYRKNEGDYRKSIA